MDYRAAANFTMPVGKYKGKTLDAIAETDEGLIYLDWMRGQPAFYGSLKEAVATYLDDPTIARELARVLEDS